MEPASKKRKAGDISEPDLPTTPKPPIIFSCPGHKADMCLTAFNQQFHVHSVMLKIHSAFFRKSIDWHDGRQGLVDQATTASSSATSDMGRAMTGSALFSGFKYSWVTKLDAELHENQGVEPSVGSAKKKVVYKDEKALRWMLVPECPKSEHFFCAEMLDADLPWDLNEVEW